MLRSSFIMNNNNMNINVMNPEDDRDENLSLSLRPPSLPPQQLPAPPFTPELDLVLTSAQTTYPTMDLNVAVNNKPPSPPLGRPRVRPPPNPQNNGEAPHNRNIEPPYAWATDRPTSLHDKAHLEEHFIDTVTGTVRCNKCGKEYPVVFNIEEKLTQFVSFVESKNGTMHDRAPPEWITPPSLVCEHCSGDGVRPVIDVNMDNINWLFLFLGQMLGYCTLEQLKYFCACNGIHRTAAKDRVLNYTYRNIFDQLLPHLSHQDPW